MLIINSIFSLNKQSMEFFLSHLISLRDELNNVFRKISGGNMRLDGFLNSSSTRFSIIKLIEYDTIISVNIDLFFFFENVDELLLEVKNLLITLTIKCFKTFILFVSQMNRIRIIYRYLRVQLILFLELN